MEQSDGYGNYHPLASFDHIAFCETLLDEIVPQAQEFINREYDRHASEARPVFAALEELLLLLRDFDEDNRVVSSSTVNQMTTRIGATLGLYLLEGLADQLGIDKDELYEHWTNVTDLSLTIKDRDRFNSMEYDEQAGIILREFMNRGHDRMRGLPVVYYGAATKIATALELGEGERASSMRNGFGFVFGVGYEVLGYLYERKQMGEINFDDFARMIDADRVTTHQEYADRMLHILDEAMEDSEELLQSIAQENSQIDSRIIDTAQALSFALHTEEDQPYMDDVAEAFFMGMNLGINAGIALGTDGSSKPLHVHRWLSSRLHKELASYGPDSHKATRSQAIGAFMAVAGSSAIPDEYSGLLERIKNEQQYSEEEGCAFENGLHYALVTMVREAEAQRMNEIGNTVRDESERLDDELEVFAFSDDLTGGLQEVYQAFLDHCNALHLNPEALAEAEADTILELTLEDYGRLMPELSSIKVNGPCFVVFQDDEGRAALIEEGGSIQGEIDSFVIASAPADDSYIDVSSQAIGQFPLRYTPSFILKNVHIVYSGGESKENETSHVIVGFVAPQTTFQRVDPERSN